MVQKPIRVLIVDDHAVVAEALALYLGNEADLEVIGTAPSGRAAIAAAVEHCPDVVLLDVRMPDMDGLQVHSALIATDRPPVVLMMTAYPRPDLLKESLTMGSSGFLSKELGLRAIPRAIRAAVSGNSVVDRSLIGSTFGAGRTPNSSGHFVETQDAAVRSLTGPEHAVLVLLAQGLDDDEIGATLRMEPRSIKACISQVYQKAGVTTRTQAAIWAIRQRISVGI